MFNIYVVHDIPMLSIPPAQFSDMQIALNHVALTEDILLPHITRPSFVNGEIKHLMPYKLLNMPTNVCQSRFMSVGIFETWLN